MDSHYQMFHYAMIDTGAMFALANRKDQHHVGAQKIFSDWTAKRNGWIVLDWIFIESMTLLKARLDAAVALRFGQQLRNNPWIGRTRCRIFPGCLYASHRNSNNGYYVGFQHAFPDDFLKSAVSYFTIGGFKQGFWTHL